MNWVVIALGMILGILIGLATGHFMPCYGAEPATAKLVIVHIDREGREYSRRIELFGMPLECNDALEDLMMQYRQAVANGYRSGMKATCFERV